MGRGDSPVTSRILAFQPGPRGSQRGRMPVVIMPVRTLHEGREWPGDEKAVARFLGGDLTAVDLIVRDLSGMVPALIHI